MNDEPMLRVNVPDFGAFQNALSTLMIEETVARIENNEVEKFFDQKVVQEKLLAWIMAILEDVETMLASSVSGWVDLTAGELTLSYLMPCFSDDINSPHCLVPTEKLDPAVDLELKRTPVARIAFRLVRPTLHHSFKLVTVNLILEEQTHEHETISTETAIGDLIYPSENGDLLHPEDDPDEMGGEFDELKARPDVKEDWLAEFTLHEDRFVPGRTRVFTNVDWVHNLSRHDEIGEMTRTLLGLPDFDVNEVDIEGQITIRTRKGDYIVHGT